MVQRTRRVSKRATSRRLNGSRSLKVSKRIKKSRRRQTRKLKTRRPIVRKRVKKTRKQTRKSRKTKKKSRNSLPPIIKSFEYRLKLLNKLKRNRKKMMKGGANTSDLLNNLKLLVKILGGAPQTPPQPAEVVGQAIQAEPLIDDRGNIDISEDFEKTGILCASNLVTITETCVKFGLSLHKVVKDIMVDIGNNKFAQGPGRAGDGSLPKFKERRYGDGADTEISGNNAGALLDRVVAGIDAYIGNELNQFLVFCIGLGEPYFKKGDNEGFVMEDPTGEFKDDSKYAEALSKSGTLIELSGYSTRDRQKLIIPGGNQRVYIPIYPPEREIPTATDLKLADDQTTLKGIINNGKELTQNQSPVEEDIADVDTTQMDTVKGNMVTLTYTNNLEIETDTPLHQTAANLNQSLTTLTAYMERISGALPNLRVKGVAKYVQDVYTTHSDYINASATTFNTATYHNIKTLSSIKNKSARSMGLHISNGNYEPCVFEITGETTRNTAKIKFVELTYTAPHKLPDFDGVDTSSSDYYESLKPYSADGVAVFKTICTCLANTHNFLLRGLTDLKGSIGDLKDSKEVGDGAVLDISRIDAIQPDTGFAGENDGRGGIVIVDDDTGKLKKYNSTII